MRNFSLKIIALVMFLITLFISVDLVINHLILPSTELKQVQVESDFPISTDQLLKMLGVEEGGYLLSLNSRSIESQLEGYSFISDAKVKKSYPSTLKVTITRKQPLFITLAEIGVDMVPVAFGRDGNYLGAGHSLETWDLPVISGVLINRVAPGIKFPESLKPLLESLSLLLEQGSVEYFMISEIKVERVDGNRYEGVLYLTPFSIPVRFSHSFSVNSIREVVMIQDALMRGDENYHSIREIDMRGRRAVVVRSGDEEPYV